MIPTRAFMAPKICPHLAPTPELISLWWSIVNCPLRRVGRRRVVALQIWSAVTRHSFWIRSLATAIGHPSSLPARSHESPLVAVGAGPSVPKFNESESIAPKRRRVVALHDQNVPAGRSPDWTGRNG